MLDIKGLTAYYGESEILHNIDLSVPDGKIIALVGRNGVGKTTTLKSIMGLVKTPSGSIELSGEALMKKPPYERARCGIGYVRAAGTRYLSTDDGGGEPAPRP